MNRRKKASNHKIEFEADDANEVDPDSTLMNKMI